MEYLTFKVKIAVFRTLAMSRIVLIALITNIPTLTVKELNKAQEEFIMKDKNLKIKHTTLFNICNNEDLKNVNILSKIVSLQCS